ncbi:MAG: choice-of-anchor D domain-containing protein, partial [Bacteroidia bacterium]|nr:choice-of-anchor D domain-containing protein [Bacteroidia bacterium]
MNITFRKLRIVLATVVCCFVFMQSNAQLNTGDIAFTAFNMDGDDDFAIVALVDIPANTTIYFTDNEAQTGGGFNTGEGYLEWNSGASIVPAGTVITFTDTDSPGNANFGSSTGTLTDGSGTLNLAGGGDAIYAYLGTSETTPTTFLAGLANTTTSTSVGDYAANGLTAGQTMIIIPTSHDGGDYNGPRAGEANFADYLALIGNVANWTTNTTNGEALLPHNTTPFTILPAAPELNILDNSTPVACGATGTTILKADSVNINGETSSITVTIENTGTGDLDVSSLSIGGTHPTDFTIDGSNPSTPFTISATSSQNITITFDPSATGAREAVLLISSNDADEASCVVPLNGVGIVQELEVLDGASSIACGATGTTIFDAGVVNTILGSASTTITISNTGTDTLIIFGLVLGGTHMSDFTLDGSVPPTPFAVLPGTSQNVVVNFDPSADGARSATLTITSDDSDELSC